MILIAVKNCLLGYVSLTISGEFCERFFNMCAYRNIALWNIRRSHEQTTFCMTCRGFAACRDICRKTHCRLHIIEKYGLYRKKRLLKKRYVFMAGAVVCLVFFLIASQFVWTIEIQGLKTESENDFREKLAGIGLREGVYKNKFDQQDLKNLILLKNPNLSWAWVDFRGAKALVTIREKQTYRDNFPANQPVNLMSNKSGIVICKNIRTGVCPYGVGDYVQSGEVLVSGIITSETPDVPPRYVHADGEVFLHTQYHKTAEFQLYALQKVYTGREKRQYRLHLLGNDLPLYIDRKLPYDQYDTLCENHDLHFGQKMYVGIGYRVSYIREYRMIRIPLTEEEAEKRAKKRLKQEVEQQLSLRYRIIDETYHCEKTAHNTIVAEMQGEYEEQAGVVEKIEIS